MKRFLALILALTMTLALTACGAGNSKPSEGPKEVNLTAEELRDALKEQLGDSYGCSVAEAEAMTMGYFNLDAEQIESWVNEVHAVTSVNMDQAIILKVKDGYAEQAAAGLQEGFNQKAGYAQLYNMDLCRINEARLFVQGNYVSLLVLGVRGDAEADAEEQAKFAAAEGEKVDAAWKSVFGVEPENLITIPEPQEPGEGGMGGGMRPGMRPRG